MREHGIDGGMLRTDFYQLTMAQLYFERGWHMRPARFEHFYRNNPDYGAHQAGFGVMAGLDELLTWMEGLRFQEAEIACLRAARGVGGARLFTEPFLAWLRDEGNFAALSIDAVPEGRVVHPNVPLTVVTGPLAMAQILETTLLNLLNFGILIATKATRLRQSAGEAPVIEFGMRRAHGAAANQATRAALIGGADHSSNTGASFRLGLPPKGTHGHSMIQAALALGLSEFEAFEQYARLYPQDTVLLVDTIDTLGSGVPNAIRVFEGLRAAGHVPGGIRLDSGDLAYLSVHSAAMLDAAGFPEVKIVLSNGLDEMTIWQIVAQIRQEAARVQTDPEPILARLVYGVGTQLVTSAGDGALGGVYKLVALQEEGGAWRPAIKVSENPRKTPTPGLKRVWRLYDERGIATADLLSLQDEPLDEERLVLHDPFSERQRSLLRSEVTVEPLLEPLLRVGGQRAPVADLESVRARRAADVARLDPGVRRLINPHLYHVSLTPQLWELKRRLVRQTRASGG